MNKSLPFFNFHQDDQINIHEQETKINMELLVEEIEKEKRFFYSHQNELQYRLSEIEGPVTFDFTNWKDISFIVIFALMTLLSFFTTCLLCKVSRLSAMLSAINAAHALENVSHPIFLIYGSQNANGRNDVFENTVMNASRPLDFQIDLVGYIKTRHCKFLSQWSPYLYC